MSIPQQAVNHCLTSKASFTEDFITRPVQTCFEKRPSYSLIDEAKDFLSKAILTRVIGATTSFFAALDAMHFLGKALHKSAIYALSKPSDTSVENPISKQDILDDLKQAAVFGLATIIGSIVGVIYPSIYCSSYFHRDNSLESLEDTTDEESELDELEFQKEQDLIRAEEAKIHSVDHSKLPLDLPTSWKETSEKVQELWSKVQDESSFKDSWQESSMYEKRVFTHLLDLDSSDKGKEARASLVNIIYTNLLEKEDEPHTYPIESWPSQTSVAYYHATSSITNLEKILTDGEVKVQHASVYKGAFTSTRPETMYGEYIIALNRNIERMSHVDHGLYINRPILKHGQYKNRISHWEGFNQAIPVNKQTVAKILLVTKENVGRAFYSRVETPEEISQKIKAWADLDVPVEYFDKSKHDGTDSGNIIPREWSKDRK